MIHAMRLAGSRRRGRVAGLLGVVLFALLVNAGTRVSGDERLPAGCVRAPAGSGLDLLCTHGEDRMVDRAAEPGGSSGVPVGPPPPTRIPCSPNNGKPVVRLFYGFSGKNELDRKAAPVREVILQAVAGADWLIAQGAKATGGVRHVRWHTPGCQLAIKPVRVPAGPVTLSSVVDALANGGHLNRVGPADKVLVVLRTRSQGSFGCAGYGSLSYDDRPGPDNTNNTTRGFAFVHCFGEVSRFSWTPTETLAHELLHTLGAVNTSAPNTTTYGHCTDESDVMCYVDGPGVRMRNVCKVTIPQQVDCRKDDYFHTSPRAGSYLDTHWNVADSRVLQTSRPGRWMRLPAPEATVRMPPRVAGPVEVRVELRLPPGTSARFVDLLADGDLVGTDAAAPYRFRFAPAALGLQPGDRVRVRARVYDALGRTHDGPVVVVRVVE